MTNRSIEASSVDPTVYGEPSLATRYVEGPGMQRLMPDVVGKRVISLACGTGEECQRLLDLGATEVIGIDIDTAALDIAQQRYPAIEFQAMDMQALDLPDGGFDAAYSSKAMHYVPDWRHVLNPLHAALTPGSKFLLSTHHPISWGGELQRSANLQSRKIGYEFDPQAEGITTYGDYFSSGTRLEPLPDEDVEYCHKPFKDIWEEITASGFRVEALDEPSVHAGDADMIPERALKIFNTMPLFLILRLARVDDGR